MQNKFEKATTKINTHFGDFDFICYSWGNHEEENILCLLNDTGASQKLVRVQSACYTAEIFRSLDCDCHEQLEASLKRISGEGGILIYMLCDGRGAGLLNKVRGLELGRIEGLDTSDAYTRLGLEQDPREYHRVVEILNDLDIDSIKLLTNNKRKVEGLTKEGIKVEMENLEIPATVHSAPYLKTKALKMGHSMRQFTNNLRRDA